MNLSSKVNLVLFTCGIVFCLSTITAAQEWEVELAARHHEAACAVAVDDSGYVYLTGTSSYDTNKYDYTTAQYSPDGDTVWLRHYDGAHEDDVASAQVVDQLGNVYVTGTSTGDSTFSDYATVKYSPTGDTVWVRRFDGAMGQPLSGLDSPKALAVDNVGSVYVTGGAWIFGSFNLDYTTIKYSTDGNTLWVRSYDGGGEDVALAVAVDADGMVYVTGTSGTIKYSAIGDTLWTKQGVTGQAMALDDSGYVYVTGGSGTIKLSPDGDTLWTNTGGRVLAVDDSGYVYVSGDSGIVKCDQNGVTIWTRQNIVGRALAFDGDGNVYVAGRYGLRSRTIKYSAAGDSLWLARTGDAGECGPGSEYRGLAVDESGDVFMAEVSVRCWNGFPECHCSSPEWTLLKYAKPVCPISLDGDANGDHNITSSDVISLVNFTFKSGAKPVPCTINGDVDCSGLVTSADIIHLVNYVFKSGAGPCDICESHVDWFWECQ